MSATGAALRAAQRREPESALPGMALRAALTLLSLLVLGYALHRLQPALDRPVKQVQVTGHLNHLTPRLVASAAAVVPGTRLFELKLQTVQARVEALPWVAHARVTRSWPDTLDVRVTERQPYARWGDQALLDTEGRSFAPKAVDLPKAQLAAMPHLTGQPGHEQDVMNAWQQLSAALAGGPFALRGLTQDARGDWTAFCRSGVVLRLGQDDQASRLDLLRNTVPQALAGRLDQVAAIDLRYTNGFAVEWAGGDKSEHCSADAAAHSDCRRHGNV